MLFEPDGVGLESSSVREAAYRDRKDRIDVEQALLFTPSLQESVPEGSAARWILASAMSWDRSVFGERSQGGSTYDPRRMLALWLLAIYDGLRSSRQIERFARSDPQYIYVLAGHCPDHATICRFRKKLEAALPKLLKGTVDKAKELGLVDMKVAAIDGTRMSGNVDHWRRNLGKVRLEEEEEEGPKGPSDPDARVQRTSKGFIVGYNAQAIIDTKSGFVIGAHLTGECTDQNQLEVTFHSCLEMAGELPETLLADGGYSSSMNATALDECGVVGYIPARHDSKWTLDENDELTCPCGSKEYAKESFTRKQVRFVRYKCKTCGSTFRVPVTASLHAWLSMTQRTNSPEGKEMQKRRRRIERLFSLTKHRYGLPRFTLRGLSGARTQWLLTLLMVNLRYLQGQNHLLSRFRAAFHEISALDKPFHPQNLAA